MDISKPQSAVAALPANSQATFPVQWSGTDQGSGLKDFTIYVSDNNGPYNGWLTNITTTQAQYPGVPGHTYRFYSIARDSVGLVESGKLAADAFTQVPLDTMPPVVSNVQVTANPAAIKTAVALKASVS